MGALRSFALVASRLKLSLAVVQPMLLHRVGAPLHGLVGRAEPRGADAGEAMTAWPGIARVLRAQALSLRARAMWPWHALGAGPGYVLRRHLVPALGHQLRHLDGGGGFLESALGFQDVTSTKQLA